ncbi:MAG: hypothetical protein K9W45_05115 [Candidatus Heimdallarchaeum aukensis]|uniref:PKD domain-containing protein n=1 Tax=Candidatus Heimdallarchaeum aukensis TaxID=2876573 RepID=A0A9Y1BMS6_9ARCH|nr:MAG: hypothetical protein K9W45_05115 [Candidatus Heimdallarchaeum aukensis]
MKKKQFIIPLVILVLLFGQITTSNAIRINTIQSAQLIKAVSSKPVFDTSDPIPTFDRDDENYQGALIIAEPSKNVTNVTIWYKLDGGDNTTIPYLFGDDGGFNLSWTEPTPMIYDVEKSNNSDIAYYNYTFDIKSDFIMFRAWYGEWEDEMNIPNVITTGVRIETYFLRSFYTQYDQIDMNISLYNYNITGYGVKYREFTPHHDEIFQNVTFSLTDEGVYTNVSAAITHSFSPGTQIEIRAFIVQFDNFTETERIYTENVAHIVTLSEGTPEITLKSDRYTNNLNVSVEWNATPISGEITAVEFNWGDGTVETLANLSIHTVYHLYDEAKEYNITINVEAGASFGNKTITILIDQLNPSGSIFVIDNDDDPNDYNITINGPKNVEIVYNTTDEGGSGVQKVRIETDEGNAYELTSANGTYTVEFLNFGYHTVYLKVYDNAGNVYTTSITFFIHGVTQPKDIGVPFSTFAIIVGIISLAVVMKKRK